MNSEAINTIDSEDSEMSELSVESSSTSTSSISSSSSSSSFSSSSSSSPSSSTSSTSFVLPSSSSSSSSSLMDTSDSSEELDDEQFEQLTKIHRGKIEWLSDQEQRDLNFELNFEVRWSRRHKARQFQQLQLWKRQTLLRLKEQFLRTQMSHKRVSMIGRLRKLDMVNSGNSRIPNGYQRKASNRFPSSMAFPKLMPSAF
ncbi:hypothetical protein ACLKA7_006052 [Drosophila subpalustris]